jgi:ATP-dependent RNA helicase DeaD
MPSQPIEAQTEAIMEPIPGEAGLKAVADDPTIKSMKSFNEYPLDPKVLEALEKMGYKTMTPIQELAIPKLLTGQDFLGQAPTGTGKTAAFGVPLISRLQPGSGNVDALILGPTRELAQQIAEELNKIGSEKGIKVLPIFGGENVFAQKDELRKKEAQVIVGTPGRVLDHLRQVSLDLTNTRMVILDEADEMLDMGFRPDLEDIFKHLPGGRETWLFSATISPEIRKIADQYMYYPEEVRIQPQTMSSASIQQLYYVVQEEEKHRMLRQMLKGQEDIYGLIFCQTKRDVVLLARKLRDYLPIDCLHGAMPQSDRDKVMDEFRAKKLKLLVATDIMARGIDVENLTHVINYSPPADPESYIHRIGRTARAGETGIAITLFTPQEKYALDILERRVKMAIQRHPESTLEFEPVEHRSRRGRHGSSHGRGPSNSSGRSGDKGKKPFHRHRKPKNAGSSPAAQSGSSSSTPKPDSPNTSS